ncbi:MAG: hypothetical protein LBF15_06195 [Candidatus Peribacteria bacterium]|nr:hypothetical protein [Candidatus Peribacteria bacterium]
MKNFRVKISLFISPEYQKEYIKSVIEKYSFGRSGKITNAIMANFIVS